MKRAVVFIIYLMFAVRPEGWSQTAPEKQPGGTSNQLDSSFVAARLVDRGPLVRRLEENTARPLSAYLSTDAGRFLGIERYELSRLDCSMMGADMGLTVGLFLGAAGMASGAWDEPMGWTIAGAAALAGALFGGTVMAKEPSFRLRLRWESDDRDLGRR
jgi:hypothetical protein